MKRTRRRFAAFQEHPFARGASMVFIFDATSFKQARRKFKGMCTYLTNELNTEIRLYSHSDERKVLLTEYEKEFAIEALGSCPKCGREVRRGEKSLCCIFTCVCKTRFVIRTDNDNCISCRHKLECLGLPDDRFYKITKTGR